MTKPSPKRMANIRMLQAVANLTQIPHGVTYQHDAMHLKAPLPVRLDPMLLTTRHSR